MLDDVLGIYPGNVELYKLALIHRSASVHIPGSPPVNNERLEFLGDAVLESIVSDYLFIEFPDADEGFLTQIRSRIVSRQALNELSAKLGLSQHVVSSAGSGFIKKHIFGDALEAMIGAVYLDKGYDFTNRLVINDIIRKHLDLEDTTATETDFKSRLIEWCHKNKHTVRFQTRYDATSTMQSPVFRSAAMIDEMEIAFGIGPSKKEAEQKASYAASQVMSDDNGYMFLEWVDHRSKTLEEEAKASVENDRA